MAEADQDRWLTYAEVGELLGCSANAARMHAARRHWPKRGANKIGERARVLVPESLDVQTVPWHVRPRAMAQTAPMSGEPNGHDQANSAAIAALVEQLGIANRRIDELQAALTEERRRVIEILTPDRRAWWRRLFR